MQGIRPWGLYRRMVMQPSIWLPLTRFTRRCHRSPGPPACAAALVLWLVLAGTLVCCEDEDGIPPDLEAHVGQAKPWGVQSELWDAINHGYEFEITTQEGAANYAPSMMRLEGMWWSLRPRTLDMTVVTQLSMDRLPRLRSLCMSWHGPISAVAYQSVVQGPGEAASRKGRLSEANQAAVSSAAGQLKALHASVEANSSLPCQLDLMFMYEVYESEEASRTLYPVNNLRNYAVLQVRTELLMHLDVDFVISKSLVDEFKTYTRRPVYKYQCKHNQLVVIPAFEVSGDGNEDADLDLAMRLAQGDKLQMLHAFRAGSVKQFANHTPSLQASTNYSMWFGVGQMMYKARYQLGYEPMFIVCYPTMHWYDVTFRGHGYNRAAPVWLLHEAGIEFLVHPAAWVIHIPHRPSPSAAEESSAVQVPGKPSKAAEKMFKLWNYTMTRMATGKKRKHDYALDPRFKYIYDRLPWLTAARFKDYVHAKDYIPMAFRAGAGASPPPPSDSRRTSAGHTATVASQNNTVFTKWDFQCSGVDDEIQIQAAMDLVGSKGGGTVLLSHGLFVLTWQLDVKFNFVVIRGAGRDATVLRLRDDARRFHSAGFIRAKNRNGFEVRDLTLDGNRAGQSRAPQLNYGRFGVFTQTCNNTMFDNLRVFNWYGYGIDPHGEGGIYNPNYNVTITNCWVEGCGYDGIVVDKHEGALVAHNTVVRCARHGINIITGTRFAVIRNNTLLHNGHTFLDRTTGRNGVGCGVAVQNNMGFGTRGAVIEGNLVRNASKAAVCLNDVEEVAVHGNVFQDVAVCLSLRMMGRAHGFARDNVCTGQPEVHEPF